MYNEALRKDIYFNTSSYTWLLGSEVLKELESTNLFIFDTFNTLFAIKVIEDVENETSIKLLKDVTEV